MGAPILYTDSSSFLANPSVTLLEDFENIAPIPKEVGLASFTHNGVRLPRQFRTNGIFPGHLAEDSFTLYFRWVNTPHRSTIKPR